MLGFRPGGIRTLVSMATDSSHRLTMGKTYKNLLLCNHKAKSLHILCAAISSGPLHKSCQPCPLGPYGPRPGGVMGKIYKKSSSLKPHGQELSYFVCSNVK